jgi:hypothetical protein
MPLVTNKGKDITNYRFGRLTVISDCGKDKHSNLQWLCICDCGESKVFTGTNLRRKLIVSCGCFRKEKSKETMTKLNLTHGLSYTKEYKTYNATKYEMAQRKQTPKWANLEKIKDIYINRPKGHHVDHIIPLQGHNVCGLHVENNLQYLTAFENISKGNKFIGV